MKHKIMFCIMIMTFLMMAFSSCTNTLGVYLKNLHQAEYSRNAGDRLLLAYAQSKDPEKRLAATQVFARIQTPQAGKNLLPLLNDQNSNVRNWAAFGLGQLRDSAMATFLVEQFKTETNSRVKNTLLTALGKSGINDQGMIFVPHLRNDNIKVAAGAAMGLAYKAMRSPLLPETVQALIHCYEARGNPEIREVVAFALFRAADTGHIEIFRKMLTDKNINVRYYAIRGLLGALNKLEDAVQPPMEFSDYLLKNKQMNIENIFSETINDKDWQIRYYAFSLLKFLKDPRIPEDLIHAPEKEHPYVIQGLIDQFKYLDKTIAEKVVNRLRSQVDPHLNGMAMVGLAGLEPGEGLDFIKKVLAKPSQPQLYYAVQVLHQLPQSMIKENKSALLKADDLFWLNNFYQILGEQGLLTKAEIINGLEIGDIAVTTIIADYLTAHPDVVYIDALIQAFEGFESPADAEPMIALLKALDAVDHPKVENFFRNIQGGSAYAILFKSKNDWRYLDTPVTGISEHLLKTEFTHVETIPEMILMSTSRGKILIRLLPEVAPVTVKSFLSLAASGYFNGLSFHRVVPGFVIQGGDPRGDGWGGPGYALPCEYSMLEYKTGMVGMAHAGMDTGGSQFFITQMPQPHLNGRYTIWGEVVEGMNIVNAILPYDTIEKIEFM